jgi:hypothetical protein
LALVVVLEIIGLGLQAQKKQDTTIIQDTYLWFNPSPEYHEEKIKWLRDKK